ncbi:uncharacterized protein EDB91DRAFT_1088516 [Suillus paluster]|uniref:uncharacterized protein n=1 Tax=Suillus paluster TaxID=48578 RepID=UPI001B8613ED|nr:uncharacterized protein EDB91DRAFT_1088516 [Suillus paluster]KAG1721228.1 hypothetical protein EDB91DRAFT_1088516 [Suillus paluster]
MALAAAGLSHLIVDDLLAENSEPQADMGQAFYAGNEGVWSPVLSDASMASNTGPENIPPQLTVHIEYPHEFKTEIHPHSGHETLLQTFEEFSVAPEAHKAPPADKEPWHPFQSHGDFEFSEIALEAALNKG